MFCQHGLHILVVADHLAFTCMFTKMQKKYVMSEKCAHQHTLACFIHHSSYMEVTTTQVKHNEYSISNIIKNEYVDMYYRCRSLSN